ncbi:MAG: response regulator [Lachnospiraceae bacterium]|nr:response regulator [Lachnospiraceae bacterium]
MEQSEKYIRWIKRFFWCFLTATMLLFAVFCALDHSSPIRPEGQTFLEDWTVTDPEGNVFTAGSSYRYDEASDGTFVMTTRLPGELGDRDVLAMVVGGDVEIYVGGELRKKFISSEEFPIPGAVVKRFYFLTQLKAEDAGAEVRVIRTGTNRSGYVYQQTFVASPNGFYSYMMDHFGLSFMLSEILLLFSLVTVVVSVAMSFMYKRKIEMLYGSMAILVISVWLTTNSYLFPFIYGHYHIDGIMNYLFCLMMPFNLAFYMDALMKGRYRKMVVIAQSISTLNCVLWTFLHFTGLFSFPHALLYIDIVLGIQVLLFLLLLTYEAILGNVREYKFTAIGFAGFLILCIFEIITLNFLPIMQDDVPMLIGLAFLLIMAVLQQISDLKKVREDGQKAVDLSEAKTRFLASMSHEIRTPINAVLGMNEMILRENKDPVIEEYAQSVKSSGQMLVMLVNDVLDFSKIEAGKLEINEAPYRLSAVLRSIMPMLKERADEKGLSIKTLIKGDVPDGQISDEFRIRQILINLGNNAIKYTDSGYVALIVSGEYVARDRFMLKICVKDTGRGISDEGQKHLFEAFSRADLKKNRSIEGTGLGLAIVKNILDSMGGDIDVVSKEGDGSEFRFKIPVGVMDQEPLRGDFMEQAPDVEPGIERCDYYAPDAKVLAVDDNYANLKLVKLFLKRAGIVPDICDTGRKAVEKCTIVRYDLILLDHMMPELDGVDVLHLIRTDPNSRNKAVPVIVLTANAVAGSRQLYLDEGFADYLTKPLDSVLLEQTVKKYLPEKKVLPVPEEKTEEVPPKQSVKERLTAIEGLDYETALAYAGEDEDLLEEVVGTIVDGCEENVEIMRGALAEGDLEQYRIQAHAVKGMLATVGLTAASEHAKQHEFAAREGNTDFLKEDSEAFFAEYLELCGRLIGK